MTSLTVLFAALHEAHVSHARRTREAEVLQEHQEPVMAEGEDCLKYQQEAHRGARNRVGRVGDEDVVVLLVGFDVTLGDVEGDLSWLQIQRVVPEDVGAQVLECCEGCSHQTM